MAQPVINRKIIFLMASLGIYGILLIVISNRNISPYSYIMNFYSGQQTSTPVTSHGNNTTRTTGLHNNSTFMTSTKLNNANPGGAKSSTNNKLTPTAPLTPSGQNFDVPNRPILTIFTTFKNTPTKEHIYKNTIHNWALLQPYVKPVMYVIPGEIDLAEYAKPLGWDSHSVPKTSSQGVPVLRHMFLDAQKKYDSAFYAYANGDILFTKDLVDSLRAIEPYKEKIKKMLLVGKRTNCQMKTGQEIRSLDEVSRIIKTGKVFSSNAQDYFISTFNGYPWDTIPDFVVGRVGYDNWLVVTALTKGMAVFDLSATVGAMHQTGTDGNMAGHSKKPKGDTYINYGLAGKKFDYSLGHVTCSQFYTVRENNMITLKERTKNGCARLFKKYRKNPYLQLPRR